MFLFPLSITSHAHLSVACTVSPGHPESRVLIGHEQTQTTLQVSKVQHGGSSFIWDNNNTFALSGHLLYLPTIILATAHRRHSFRVTACHHAVCQQGDTLVWLGRQTCRSKRRGFARFFRCPAKVAGNGGATSCGDQVSIAQSIHRKIPTPTELLDSSW